MQEWRGERINELDSEDIRRRAREEESYTRGEYHK